MVLVALRTGSAPVRLGLSVPRKFGSAVSRNRFKRRLRDIFRRADISLQTGGADLCILSRPEGARAEFQAIRDEFLLLWNRAERFLESPAPPECSPGC